MQEQALKPHQRKRNRYSRMGGILVVLAAIGLITVLILSIRFTTSLFDNSSEKAKFERFIAPVTMFLSVPFENVKEIDPLVMLQCSIWSALYSDKRDSYIYDDEGRLILPASDVDVAEAKLFGSEVKLEHKTFGDFEISYYFDEEIMAYRVPVTGQISMYTPKVEKISKDGNKVILRVGYIPPGTAWTMDFSGKKKEPNPDKYMIYELTKVGKEYNLTAVRDIPTENPGYSNENT